MQKRYCVGCHKEVEVASKCECGSRKFIYGRLKLTSKGIVCKCGNEMFTQIGNSDYTIKTLEYYSCNKCGNSMVLEIYKDIELPF